MVSSSTLQSFGFRVARCLAYLWVPHGPEGCEVAVEVVGVDDDARRVGGGGEDVVPHSDAVVLAGGEEGSAAQLRRRERRGEEGTERGRKE